MSQVLIVGAGRLGKGFLGETFFNAGWKIGFLDNDPRVTEELQRTGTFTVKVHSADDIINNTISGYNVFDCDDNHSCMDFFLNTDVVCLPLYPSDFEEAASYLAPCFEEQMKKDPTKKMTLICLTNKNHIIEKIKGYFLNNLSSEAAKAWFKENVAFRDSIVRRSTDAPTNYSTDLVTTAVASLLIQSPVYNPIDDVQWLELRDNIEMLKDIKVFTINGPHAATAYMGYLRGMKTIPEASADPIVGNKVNEIHDLIVKAVMEEYPITREELKDLEYLPKAKNEIPDSIRRVAYDPIRKLGKQDRLIGTALLCQKHGIDFEPLAYAIACAFSYDDPSDLNAVKLQKEIQENGLASTVTKVTGLPQDHPIAATILRFSNNLKQELNV
ncbi:mannitol dehydrogenase [Oceanobacillus jeddahense]|uniref:mannitol dehydrogenase family protein n=1 Tax=Oceanobacillus jeddahense TaxID=1462527 RepID=UPI000595A573|nr:mannitol dehydrogenase [Oceanobacillus jeddahense]